MSSILRRLTRARGKVAKNPLDSIVHVGHPVLRQQAQLLSPQGIKNGEYKPVVESLVETMRASPWGVALAAPQIAQPLQLFCMEVTKEVVEKEHVFRDPKKIEMEPLPLTVIANPTLSVGRKIVTHREGCLSIEGYSAHVPRAHDIRLSGLCAVTGEEVSVAVSGWTARIIQHECDHLQGKLFIDSMVHDTFAIGEELFRHLHPLDFENDGAKPHTSTAAHGQ
eukprot:m.30820 g.30820  ORF g.30820 m.30820 type:complete len:223 (+) comp9665_c0_seq3:81-749(+)